MTLEAMRDGLRLGFVTLAGLWGISAAQTPPGKAEREIWALIQAQDTGTAQATDSVIFASAAYPRPIIGAVSCQKATLR
jgi:hypothetical protein